MASSLKIHSFTLLLLIPFISSVYGGREPPNPNNVYNLVPLDSLRPATTCSSSSSGSNGVKVVHRYGPCSGNSAPPTSHQIFVRDQSRVNFINNKKKSNSIDPASTTPALADSILGAGNYLVTVGFGTPEQKNTLILDTGSELTWVQCKPCSIKCYPQKEPIFDPSASSTSSSTSCSTRSCDYSYTYADKSYSRGQYANDTLTLPGSGTFPNFIFGCGQDNSDGFGDAAGMLGLSKGSSLSIVSQTQSTFAQIFCYCLTPREGSTGFLLFGLEALRKCQTKTFTPLLTHTKRPRFYFVDLVGVTIGAKRLAVSSFYPPNSKTPNTIFDSGTVITRLPGSVYSDLRAEFRSLMAAYPGADPLPPLLDTCYDLTGHVDATIPRMVMHFKGADVALDSSGVIWWEKDSQVCLAFAGNENAGDLNIIGNNQQKSVGILHDIQENKVEFSANAC